MSTETNGVTKFQCNSKALFKLQNKTQHALIIVFIIETEDGMKPGTLGLWDSWDLECLSEPQLLYLLSCVTLHKFPNFLVPKFSALKDGDNKYIMVPVCDGAAIYKY